ncbi:hypothetical protein CMI37_31680 [Candidatus Pacearchaeota archaeon]|nr:hypothetical protein [Candidatus Pacearchaeota archaeon]|tara:strand:- start:1592 stop:2161 length:570 start_codon:yes stop_codon:yes gene_type:complete
MTTEQQTPSTVASDATLGDVAWSSPTNATTEDASVASASFTGLGETSEYLKATNFGFSVPGGATIDGITARFKAKQTAFAIFETEVKLVKGGTISGTDKSASTGLNTSTLTFISFGGASDLWGLTLSSTDVNASTFGVAMRVDDNMDSGDAEVDVFDITVHYTAAAGGGGGKFYKRSQRRRVQIRNRDQ